METLTQSEIIFFVGQMILIAIPVGFFAGLFGIGGGLISVPFLYYLFNKFGMDPAYVMHLAVGTSFSIIIPTSIVSVLTHHKYKAVDFSIVKSYGLFVIIGVVFGTIFAASLKTKPLVLFFSIVVFILAFYLLYLKEKETDIKIEMKLISKICLPRGLIVGFWCCGLSPGAVQPIFLKKSSAMNRFMPFKAGMICGGACNQMIAAVLHFFTRRCLMNR